jgi:predicted peroxiredoxin
MWSQTWYTKGHENGGRQSIFAIARECLDTVTAGRLMRIGVAEALEVKAGSGRPVFAFIQEAHRHGATFCACPANLDLFGMTREELIRECAGMMSTTQMVTDIMEDECRVLTD